MRQLTRVKTMNRAENTVREKLFSMKDEKYKAFQCRLMPTVDPEKVIGVRTPDLRKLAAEFSKTDRAREFLASLPHDYYEENNLHAMLIERLSDFDEAAAALDIFLPYVDNWATCDLMTPKIFKKQPEKLIEKIPEWLESGNTYTVRFAIRMIMCFFLDDGFDEKYLELVAAVNSGEYYINMMIAWFFATALAKQYGAAVKYLEENRLSPWVHGKTIQKATESFRISGEAKAYLRTLKRK